MKKYLILMFFLLVGCTSKVDSNAIEVDSVKQEQRVNSINVSTEDRFVLTQREEVAVMFEQMSNQLIQSKLMLVYQHMYSSQGKFVAYLSDLQDVDTDGEMSFNTLKDGYLSLDPNDKNLLRAKYNLLMLASFMRAESSASFFEKEALRTYDSCDMTCEEWHAMTSALAVRGLLRLYANRPLARKAVTASLFNILKSENASDDAVLEAIEVINLLGMPKSELADFIHETRIGLLNIEAVTELPVPISLHEDESVQKHYGSDDPAPQVGEIQ